MDDSDVFARINDLAHEEERLWASASDGSGMTPEERRRLHELQIALDQCYDLLHQRAAKRAAGEDPREATIRPPEVVENYQQ